MDAGFGADAVAGEPLSQDCPADKVVDDVAANVHSATSDSKDKRWAASLRPTP